MPNICRHCVALEIKGREEEADTITRPYGHAYMMSPLRGFGRVDEAECVRRGSDLAGGFGGKN
ncbi:MAG: hypothetical protein ACFCD0_13505 [Gemmataceae bacterium]